MNDVVQHRLTCSGYRTHDPRRVGTYMLFDDGGFAVTGPSSFGRTNPDGSGTAAYHFACPTCTRKDMRFSADSLGKFLRAPGAATKDLSVLERILS